MYRGFIKEITNLAGQPIGNADLRVRNISIRRDILTSASSEFEVLGIPEQAKEGNIFGCYDEYGKIIYLGVITNIDDNTIQTNQIISLFNDKWLYNRPSTITEVIGTSSNLKTIEAPIEITRLNGNTFQNGTPTPTSPIEVQSVKGDNEVKVVGKNLCSPLTIGVGINASNGAEITNSGYACTDFIPVNFSTSPAYYLSGLVDTLYSFIGAYNSQKQFLGRTSAIGRSEVLLSSTVFIGGTPQGTGDIAYLRITQYENVNVSGTISEVTNAQFQLEKGSTATTYEPYTEQSYTINLGILELNKIGNYSDYLYKSGDKWYVHKEVGNVTLNGSEAWNMSNDGTKYAHWLYGSSITNYKEERLQKYCNYYPYEKANWRDGSSQCLCENTNSGSLLIFRNDSITTVADWKTWLASNNTTVYYTLATATETEITDTTLISQLNALSKAHSYDGVTNVVQSGSGVGFNLQFNYSKSADTIEQAVEMILQSDFQNNRDSLMQTIFSQFDIDIDSSGTYLTLPSQKENYVMNFMEFIFQLYENYQILLDIDIKYNATRPSLTILKPSYPTLKLSNNNNSLQNFNVMTETYETNKLVLYSREGTLRGIWYGTENGITTNANADRLPKIKTNIVFSDDPAEDIIADNLSNQMYNHKIELDLVLNNKLYNFDDFKLGQAFEIHYGGKTYDSVLTGYEIKINENGTSDIVNLVFGIVRVSLVDKLNRLIIDADSDTASYSTQAKEDGDGNVITETYETKADASDTYVKKSGDTMTGLLEVDDSIRSTNNMLVKAVGANARFRAQDTTHGGEIRLTWGGNHQHHGLLSTGYSTDGSTLTSSNMWLIYRTSDNKVRLNGGKATIDTSGNFRAEGYASFGGALYADGGDVTSGSTTRTANSFTGAHSIAGKIYLYAYNTNTSNKGLGVMNNAGTYKEIIQVDQNNVATFNGHTTRSVGWFKHSRTASIAPDGTDMPPKVLIKQVGSDFSIVSGNIRCARAGTIRVTAKIFAWHNSTNGGAMTCWIRISGVNNEDTKTTLSWFTNGVLYIEGIFEIGANTNLSVQIKNVSASGNLSVQPTSTYIVEYLD